ncbi:MAG: bifunctional (p)ppGpp synthetase/guanosine-3',5'-bis(diphosphate) 3'-pyrophosphohydrolase [Bacteroidales bacterium]|nr:bifunctional (p)ppGpp synthetase/guanosine-3',5'-bis(diphosphate) 3'-pyrophosphohydrolase [Bacteroidales bacterium]
MGKISEFKEHDYEVIAREYADLMEVARKRCSNTEEQKIIHKAFEFANQAHKGVRRRSGEPYIIHPIAVAKIVVTNIGLGYKSIVAALLHDVVEDTDYTVDDLRNLFGDKVATLVEGLTKIKTVLDNEDKAEQKSMQAENFKRILLTLNDDVRVVLIKLADRLHNCRTIDSMPDHKRDKILSETMFVFIPLAHRLGLYGIKSEMEDIWLKYKEPEAYNDIKAKINRNISDKEKEIDQFIIPIREALKNADMNFEIKKRVKTPYSIWHKMNTKGVTFEQIYDLYAVRIIFDPSGSKETERDICYHIFSIITAMYKYKSDRVRDWVNFPKSNGYEALHCTLMSHTGIWIETQIRSTRMNEIAEKGIAAHWLYKKDGQTTEGESEMDKWITKVKEILVSPDINALELLDLIHDDLLKSEILVFTPKGDQKTIDKGATALDFAYLIHSHIGAKAIAAKINLKLVPLSTVLRTGDQVEIITAENERPKQDWLHFVQTSKARKLILDQIKSERHTFIKTGRTMLTERLKEIGKSLNDKVVGSLMHDFEMFDSKPEELFFKIGCGMIPLDDLAERLKKYYGINSESYFIVSNSDANHKFVLAPCCTPILGESVVGFKSADGTITVHTRTCKTANSLAAKFGDKIVSVKWGVEANSGSNYLARLALRGTDRIGMINDITRITSKDHDVNIRRFNLGTEDGVFDGFIDLYVHNIKDLEKLIDELKGIKGIESVTRTEL